MTRCAREKGGGRARARERGERETRIERGKKKTQRTIRETTEMADFALGAPSSYSAAAPMDGEGGSVIPQGIRVSGRKWKTQKKYGRGG